MNADQVIEGIGNAVAVAQTAQEYCLLGFWGVTWWPLCMTKSEWSGWAQAIGSILAILITAFIARRDSIKREEDKRISHAKEMRRLSYFLNKTGLSECLYFLLASFGKSNISKFSNIEINYKNIFFVICMVEPIRKAFEIVKGIDSSASMELLTSKCSDEFFIIFNSVESLNGFCNLKELHFIFDRDVFVVKSYVDFISSKNSDELNSIDENLKISVGFMKQQLQDLKRSSESIRNHMKY